MLIFCKSFYMNKLNDLVIKGETKVVLKPILYYSLQKFHILYEKPLYKKKFLHVEKFHTVYNTYNAIISLPISSEKGSFNSTTAKERKKYKGSCIFSCSFVLTKIMYCQPHSNIRH